LRYHHLFHKGQDSSTRHPVRFNALPILLALIATQLI